MDIIECLYYLGVSAKKNYLLRNCKRLPLKVISIGNLTVGGTGKTPATIAVAQEAQKRGMCPVILTRGYKGSAKGPCFVTKGSTPLLNAEQAGDEPLLMSERLNGVPIIKGSNRYESGLFAINAFGTNTSAGMGEKRTTLTDTILFILDDGFQHWGLHRDIDIVLIDANNPFGNRKLLPMGILREPIKAISRADAIVLTKNETAPGKNNSRLTDLRTEIRQYNHATPIFMSEHIPVGCRLVTGETRPVNWIKGKRVFGFCALGSPESFEKTISYTGAELAGLKKFSDHHKYSKKDLFRIKEEAKKSGAGWIATTEKDIIKIRDLDLPENIIIIEIAFSAGTDFYDKIFSF